MEKQIPTHTEHLFEKLQRKTENGLCRKLLSPKMKKISSSFPSLPSSKIILSQFLSMSRPFVRKLNCT